MCVKGCQRTARKLCQGPNKYILNLKKVLLGFLGGVIRGLLGVTWVRII